MAAKNADGVEPVLVAGNGYINIESSRGEALARFLRSRGVTCTPPQPSSDGFDSIAIARGVDLKFVQKLLDGWPG